MSITTNRNIGLMAHLTKEQKEGLRIEAIRRKISMSELVSIIIENWLITAPQEQIEFKRSNKRVVDPLKDVPLPLENE